MKFHCLVSGKKYGKYFKMLCAENLAKHAKRYITKTSLFKYIENFISKN